jgi:hypothetical protein
MYGALAVDVLGEAAAAALLADGAPVCKQLRTVRFNHLILAWVAVDVWTASAARHNIKKSARLAAVAA